MIESIFSTVGSAITEFASVIGNGFTGIISLFYNSTTSALTPLGELMLIGVGVGLVYMAFRMIKNLISLRRA